MPSAQTLPVSHCPLGQPAAEFCGPSSMHYFSRCGSDLTLFSDSASSLASIAMHMCVCAYILHACMHACLLEHLGFWHSRLSKTQTLLYAPLKSTTPVACTLPGDVELPSKGTPKGFIVTAEGTLVPATVPGPMTSVHAVPCVRFVCDSRAPITPWHG